MMGQGAMGMTQPAAPVYDATPTPVSGAALSAQGGLSGHALSDPRMLMIAQLLKQGIPQRAMQQQMQQPNAQAIYQQYLNQYNGSR